MFPPVKPFQPSLLLLGKDWSLPIELSAWKMFYVGKLLPYLQKSYTILERLASNEPSRLLRKFATYGRKKFNNIGPGLIFAGKAMNLQ